jgi:hypothetical protein
MREDVPYEHREGADGTSDCYLVPPIRIERTTNGLGMGKAFLKRLGVSNGFPVFYLNTEV